MGTMTTCACAPCQSGRPDVGCSHRFPQQPLAPMYCARCWRLLDAQPGSWGSVEYRCSMHGRVNEVITGDDRASRATELRSEMRATQC